MGKYDKVFNSEKKSKETLTPQEAVAAIAVVTAAADSSLEDVDVELLADILWGFEIFEEYSDDDLFELVDKLIAIAEEEGLGALFNSANESMGEELVLDAFAAGVSVLVDEEELKIPKGKTTLLKKLQSALEVEEEEAKEVIEEVIAAFEEAEEEFAEDDDEIVLESDEQEQVYESPLGNFTVQIPVDAQQGGRIQSTEGVVGFSDDSGTMLRIDYYPIPEEQTQESSPDGQENYLKSIVLEKYVPQAIVANLPDASVKYTEYLEGTMGGAYFVVINMPEGATISKTGNNGTATRLDAYRGLLAFTLNDFLYIVSSQRSFLNGETPGSIEEEAESIKQKILEFVDTIEFT